MKMLLLPALILGSASAFARDNQCITFERACAVIDNGTRFENQGRYTIWVQASTPEEPSSSFNRYSLDSFSIRSEAQERAKELRASGYCK